MKKTITVITLVLILASQALPQNVNQFSGVNSASYVPQLTVGLSSLFTGTSRIFTRQRCIAASAAETNLCGVEVFLNGQNAPLLFVSPNQINLFVDPSLYDKEVNVRVRSEIGEQFARLKVSNNPGIFTANGLGNGFLAATQTADGVNYFNTSYFDRDLGVFVGIPVQSKYLGQQNFLILSGTGLKYNVMACKVAFVSPLQTLVVTPDYVGSSPGLLGVDQVNVKIPPLPGGHYSIVVISDGVLSNAGRILLADN